MAASMNVSPHGDNCLVSAEIPPQVIDQLIEFVAGIRRRFQDVLCEQPVHYEIAGLPICFKFLDSQLEEQISPAFEHLRSEKSIPPELTVLLDGVSAADANFSRIPDWEGWGKMDIWVVEITGMVLLIQSKGRAIVALDFPGKIGYWLELHSTGMAYLDRAAPMNGLLTFWFGSRKRYLFHGAGVGESDGGVLILGRGGAGKSTTALACLEAGLHFAGDDYCLLSMNGTPWVHSLYGCAKLSNGNHFPFLESVIDEDGRTSAEKGVYRLNRLHGNTLKDGFPLRAILLAHIMEIPETTITAASHSKGFLALAPSAGYQLPGLRQQALSCFSSAARQLPVYDLNLGANLRSTPTAIRQLLQKLR
jgi:hypothetical protein